MIMVFIMMRPYKQSLVNSFSIANEFILFIIGFYLFIFLDEGNSET